MKPKPLADRHIGEVATIVGRGPSLLGLTADDFGPGPVMVLNHAIDRIRELDLPNPVYSFQKDGCLVEPQPPEALVLSTAQSRKCFPRYDPRYVIDVRSLGLPVGAMSSAFAVAVAHQMGCRRVRMLAMDSRQGDFRTVVGSELKTIGRGYLWAIEQASRWASKHQIEVDWA